MDAYSAALTLALVAVVVAALARIVARLAPGDEGRWRRLSGHASAAGLAAAGFALLLHFWVGHRPGTSEALAPIGFVLAHPTLLATLVVAGFLLWLARRDGVE